MKHIDTTLLASLTEMLETEKTTLRQELSRIGKENPQTGDWYAIPEVTDGDADADYSDQADYVEEFESRSAQLGELEIRLKDVVDALEKINNNTYGVCEKSGEPIEIDRLQANPAARTSKAHMN
jgi:DnaK suppressor protein